MKLKDLIAKKNVLEEKLTELNLTLESAGVLLHAYEHDYFEYPRKTNIESLVKNYGISHTSYHRLLSRSVNSLVKYQLERELEPEAKPRYRPSLLDFHPWQREILGVMKDIGKPVRPSRIIESLPQDFKQKLQRRGDSRIYYHFSKLELDGLITKIKEGRKLSHYELTDKGKELF